MQSVNKPQDLPFMGKRSTICLLPLTNHNKSFEMFAFMVCNILTKWCGVAKHDNKTKASNNYREKEK